MREDFKAGRFRARMRVANSRTERLGVEAEHAANNGGVPTSPKGIKDELEIRKERCTRHIFGIEPELGGQDDGVIVRVEVMIWQAGKELLLACESHCGRTGDARSAVEESCLMRGQLGAWPDKTHITAQHVEKLREFIQLPATQEWTDRRKGLVANSRDGTALRFRKVDHGAELEDGEGMTVKAHPPLQEEHGAFGGEANHQSNQEKYRDQQRQREKHAGAIEATLGS